ncbi:MAG TPA: arginase family protein [Diaminobutyricibacter sp.]
MARRLVVIGAPSSAGSYAAGQESAPRVLRERGLIGQLAAAGRDVVDDGDGPHQVWRPDRDRPRAQHLGDVIASVEAVTRQVGAAMDAGCDALVIGGNCTIALGALSALSARFAEPGLLYIDRHFDLNTPSTTSDGALDWMGLAHALAVPGAIPELLSALARIPLLTSERLHLLGVDPDATTEGERRARADLHLVWRTGDELAQHPVSETQRALARLAPGPIVVHLDVDVLDFTDAPLAEDTGGRNSGPSLDAVAEALETACHDPSVRVLTVGELNPTRSAGEPEVLDRFIRVLARAFAAA